MTASADTLTCFHCGLPVTAAEARSLRIAGEPRSFCCAGCEAVAVAISGAGLDAYYRLREQAPGQPPADARSSNDHAAYDDPVFQASFVVVGADGCRDADLLLEGVRCSACVWLNER